MKIDLHVHTVHSDGSGTVKDVLRTAKSKGLDGLAITDHNTIEGYFEAESYDFSLLVLPGYEVCTDAGHVLVIGLERTPPKIEIIRYEDLIRWVRKLGGLTILAHPAAGRIHLDRWICCKPDAVEVLNASYPICRFFMKRSLNIADRLEVPSVAGSDAHCPENVGNSYTVVDASNPSNYDVIKAIKYGNVSFEGKLSPFSTRIRAGLGYMLSVMLPGTHS
ncbi:MAG: CehA/McbA family metallohydrolase [Candidatus Bathyarchaeia archaeon]